MSDVTVTRSNVGEQSLKVQNEFISNDIDRRIRIEKVAPMWLVQALLEDIMDEAKEELVKEAVADVSSRKRSMRVNKTSEAFTLTLIYLLTLCSLFSFRASVSVYSPIVT